MQLAHREMRRSRVLVAAAGLLIGLLALWLRIGWLQVGMHGYYEGRADRNQEQRVLLRPGRGNLLDRNGRLMARDLLTYSISAAPREMKSPRQVARQLASILGRDARRLERDFAARPRFLWVERRVAPEIGQKIADLKIRGVYLSPETRREYPFGVASAEIIGRTNLDNQGVDGLELQLDEKLRGRPGWATMFRDGRGRAHAPVNGMTRAPLDGMDAVLTLDADLQAIVETHLAKAVDTLNARRGFAMFLDPATGEVLAAVTVPHLEPGKARNWNFTDTFEPGSTFKVVVAGAVLEENLARPDQVFEASATGAAPMVPGTIFHDTHHEARYRFFDAVRWSSNIVMGRLGLLLGAERLYRYATALGFGSITGIEFPGEAGGKLRSPDRWSPRSTPTIAIGHELSVTPLQLTLAYAAIANGGVLMRPSLVRELRDANGGVAQTFSPSAAQRVFSASTCASLRSMLTAVVDSGTARSARIPGYAIAGKTGTAQKYDAAAHTYGKGLYVSSFAGFAPAENPSLVGVVVIDEPRGKHYYGGDVAAPVFKRVIVDLMGLPRAPLRGPSSQVAMRPPAPAPVTVPDVALLPRLAAERALCALTLHGRFIGNGPRVITQEPAAGTAVERGARVDVYLAAGTDSAETTMPDLTGLAWRDAMRELNRRQVTIASFQGHGLVIGQSPPAGTPLPLTSPCVLRCEPRNASEMAATLAARPPAATGAAAGSNP
jgi:cell division protein FtsI/penicillin-binding protein 2